MPHVLELLKIIEGALAADRTKVAAYAEQLAQKLEADGESRVAGRLRRVLRSVKTADLSPSRLSTTRVPVDGESRLSLADEESVEVNEAEVFLSPDPKRDLDEFLSFVAYSDKLFENGVGVVPSMLLHGPPGCGKTEIARSVSAQLGLPLITARTDALISSYLGSTAKNLRLLFEHASSRPCILFLDEFDAVAKLRDDPHELGELKRVVVSLLQNIDALDGKTVLLAATNHEHLLDPAVWRRFSFRLRIDPPDGPAREALFGKFFGDSSSRKENAMFAVIADGMSGADIREVAQAARRTAVLHGELRVSEADVLRRLVRLRLPDAVKSDAEVESGMAAVRGLSAKVFTYRRLADLFKVSLGTVSNKLGAEAAV